MTKPDAVRAAAQHGRDSRYGCGLDHNMALRHAYDSGFRAALRDAGEVARKGLHYVGSGFEERHDALCVECRIRRGIAKRIAALGVKDA